MRFGSLDIRFDDAVLRPRPWTIAQSLWAAELSAKAPQGSVLELCTGVGQIGLELASRVSRQFVLVDVDQHACGYARDNAKAAGLAERVDVRSGPMDAVLVPDEQFALILADPPWVRADETARFPLDPLLAIDGGHDGLRVARICIDVIGKHLVPGGAAIIQLGDAGQAEEMKDHLEASPHLCLRVEEVRAYDGDGVLVLLARTSNRRP